MRVRYLRRGRKHRRPDGYPGRALASSSVIRIVDLGPYEACRVAAVVERLTIEPLGANISATVSDGTGRLVARWSLVRPTPQLAVVPGRSVLLEGMTNPDENGLLLIDPIFFTAPSSLEA